MTPEAQRIAIAEACGWKRWSKIYPGRSEQGWKKGESPFVRTLPDYLNDLNAMHEAEKVLFDQHDRSKWFRYLSHLQNAACCGGNATHEDHVHATAAQRAEAFLRTIGKWQDSTEQKAHKCTQ